MWEQGSFISQKVLHPLWGIETFEQKSFHQIII